MDEGGEVAIENSVYFTDEVKIRIENVSKYLSTWFLEIQCLSLVMNKFSHSS